MLYLQIFSHVSKFTLNLRFGCSVAVCCYHNAVLLLLSFVALNCYFTNISIFYNFYIVDYAVIDWY